MTKREPNEAKASAAQIHEAFEALTDAELVKLNDFARYRFQALGVRRQGRDPDELVTDAIVALLDGRRAWKPSRCSFFICLIGVIRSQAFHLRKDRPRDAFDELEVIRPTVTSQSEPFEDRESDATSDPLLALDGNEVERVIRERFEDDPEAALVLEALLEGHKPADIREGLHLSQKDYETIVRRIRRAVHKLIDGVQS
jgi:DNA-directed RNA polymerase specialized sigma24 family protein